MSSADLSWTSAHQTSAARLRTGYRVYGDVSLGLEAGLNANRMGEDVRAGVFGRYAWDGGEFLLATGLSGRFLDDAQSLQDPYATVNCSPSSEAPSASKREQPGKIPFLLPTVRAPSTCHDRVQTKRSFVLLCAITRHAFSNYSP